MTKVVVENFLRLKTVIERLYMKARKIRGRLFIVYLDGVKR